MSTHEYRIEFTFADGTTGDATVDARNQHEADRAGANMAHCFPEGHVTSVRAVYVPAGGAMSMATLDAMFDEMFA